MELFRKHSTRDMVPGGFFYLSIAILFVSFGYILISQNLWDYDFWWHIATGRYIVETGSIPKADPFSFTSQLAENSNLYPLRERFILTQYWLAQVIFYFLFNAFGPAGIGILRVATLLCALGAIFLAFRDREVSPYISYPFLFLAFVGFLRSSGERPVLFTILLTVISFVLVDNYVRRRSRLFFLLPGVMLLWSNLHGGFILGDVIIIVFLLVEGTRAFLGRSEFNKREKIIFFSVMCTALGASGINPNGFYAFDIAFSAENAPFYTGIQEYQPPFRLWREHLTSIDYAYLAALILFPLVLLLRKRKFNPSYFIILIILCAGSVSAARFTVYYCLIGSLVLGVELDRWLKEHSHTLAFQGRMDKIFSIVMITSSVLYAAGTINTLSVKMKEAKSIVPIGAANFMKENKIRGNILNDMGAGGYLAWRLYPDVKTFIDTRSLNFTVMNEYSWLALARESIFNPVLPPGKVPLWKRLLEHYEIKAVVFAPLDVYGNLLPIIGKLLDDDGWAPVYADVVSVIYLKNIPENRQLIDKFRKPREEVLNQVIVRIMSIAMGRSQNPRPMEGLGDAFMLMGRKEDAIKAYNYALKRHSDEPRIREKLEQLQQKEEKKKDE